MRTTGTCPKCKGRKIWLIERMSHATDFVAGSLLSVAYQRAIGPVEKPLFLEPGPSKINVGHFDAYVCAGCGYTEWYARDFAKLQPNPRDGVRLLDGEGSGPSR